MKKLTFINGSLLFACLEGAAIIQSLHDGYDFHVLMKNPNQDNENASKFTVHTTNLYKSNNEEFGVSRHLDNKDVKRVKAEFEKEVEQVTKFKEEYPKEVSKLIIQE